MSRAWVAGSVRAVALSRRRLGAAAARSLARSPDTAAAVEALAATPYGRDVRAGQSLAEAQHAVGVTLLWHLRVLAGWQPREGADVLRLLAAGFEVANVAELLGQRPGREAEPPYHLGTLETAWSRLSAGASPAEVQKVLGASAWGDPGAATPSAILTGMRLAWADRVAGGVPEAAGWARAAAALVVAREVLLAGSGLTEESRLRAAYLLGQEPVAALSRGTAGPADLAPLLPSDLRWVFEGVVGPQDLWRAEAGWWRRLERDGFALMRCSVFGRPVLVGSVALLAVDAWRVRAALETAAWAGGGRATEAFDGVA